MLLTLSKGNQGYENYMSNFHQTFTNSNQQYLQSYQPVQATSHGHSQYPYIQPNLCALSQQTLSNFRSRKRRTSHNLVATMDPVAVARRNERERNRVKQVNDGFNELRKKIPYIPEKKKFSKVEILRFAMRYIRELQELITDSSYDESKSDISPSTCCDFPEEEELDMSDFSDLNNKWLTVRVLVKSFSGKFAFYLRLLELINRRRRTLLYGIVYNIIIII